MDDLVGHSYRAGGRDPDEGVDCLWVVIQIAERRGCSFRDPWDAIACEAGVGPEVDPAQVAPNRSLVEGPARQDDIVLLDAAHQAVAYVHDGYVYSASPGAGSYRRPLHRVQASIRQIWRLLP